MTQAVDVAIVGYSLAGCLCALQLRERRLSVSICMIAEIHDFNAVDQIPQTILNATNIPGDEFLSRANGRMASIGIIVDAGYAVRLTESPDFATVGMDGGFERAAGRVVFAPVGDEVGAPELGADQLYGVGVSMDAASDAPLLAGLRVAVLGGGCRAAQEALLAVRAGVAHTFILCEDDEPDFGIFAMAVKASAKIDVMTGVHVLGLRKSAAGDFPAAAGGALRAVSLRDAGGREHDVEVSWLFLSRGLECDLSVLGGVIPGRDTRIVRAGVAAGIPYCDRLAMIRSAQAATDQILASSSRRRAKGIGGK
jgi:thioredoxin reductase